MLWFHYISIFVGGPVTVKDTPSLQYSSFPVPAVRNPKAYRLLQHIHSHFRTLVWGPRWLDQSGQKSHAVQLNELIRAKVVEAHPPLMGM
jgi:hypothetical protein